MPGTPPVKVGARSRARREGPGAVQALNLNPSCTTSGSNGKRQTASLRKGISMALLLSTSANRFLSLSSSSRAPHRGQLRGTATPPSKRRKGWRSGREKT